VLDITAPFTIETGPMPVELLRDERGIYGIGVSDLCDYEAVAWSCGVEPELCTFGSRPSSLILRPDCFADTKPSGAALQKIVGGLRRGPFIRTSEERLRQFIHHTALHRAGLPWPPTDERWWSTDEKQQARNRGIYHGLRQLSLHVVNKLMGQALETAADGEAIRAARRFNFGHRERIYRAGALSGRTLQLIDTFPVLAMTIYSDHWRLRPRLVDFSGADFAARQISAAHLVDRGARLRDIAAVMNIPMTLRHIKPSVAHLATEVLCQHPESLAFMPDTAPRQRIWLLVVNWAYNKVSTDFGAWAARHVPQIPGRLDREVGAFVSDLAGWVRAGDAGGPAGRGQEFVVRPFAPSMSLKTVTALSADWHEAVASHMDGPDVAFPPPWYPPAKVGGYEIVPIDNSAALYREGAAMKHCVGTYAGDVRGGGLYVYSVHRNGERTATFALARGGLSATLTEIRGPCNAQPNKQIFATVRRWLRAQPPLKHQPSALPADIPF
jgi:hypothetical protein